MNLGTEIRAAKKIGASGESSPLIKAVRECNLRNANILPCSVERFRQHEAHKARMRELRKAVEVRYAEQLARVGWWRRMELRRLINTEYRREAERVGPSSHTL